MDNRDFLSRLLDKFNLATTSTASLFSLFFFAIAGLFLLLLLAIQFGWSTIAGVIFVIAAMGASLFCMLVDAVMSRFGKGRSVFLGIIVLYLNLMSALAFSAPDFFSELSLRKWMAMSMIFFTATGGGSFALVSYERASRLVSIVIILINAMVLVPDNSISKGVINVTKGMMNGLAGVLGEIDHIINPTENLIRQRYLDQYLQEKALLNELFEKHQINAQEYEQRIMDLENRYHDKIAEKTEPPPSSTPQIYESVIATGITNNNPTGVAEQFFPGPKTLYLYVRYNKAIARKTVFSYRWFKNGSIIGNATSQPLNSETGFAWCSHAMDFTPGNYHVQLLVEGKIVSDIPFTIIRENDNDFNSDLYKFSASPSLIQPSFPEPSSIETPIDDKVPNAWEVSRNQVKYEDR